MVVLKESDWYHIFHFCMLKIYFDYIFLGVNPCESRTCHGYETCAINRFGIAQCVCAAICDPVFRPVSEISK